MWHEESRAIVVLDGAIVLRDAMPAIGEVEHRWAR